MCQQLQQAAGELDSTREQLQEARATAEHRLQVRAPTWAHCLGPSEPWLPNDRMLLTGMLCTDWLLVVTLK